MGRNQTGERKYQIENVWEVHHEVARRILLGEKNVDIAKDMNISPVMVSYTRNSHKVKALIAELESRRDGVSVDIAQDIQELCPLAIKRMGEMLAKGTEKDSDMIKIGFGVLDRGGHSPVKRSINVNGALTKDMINNLKTRGLELQSEAIDVTSKEVKPESKN